MPKISKEISDWFDYPNDPLKGRVKVRLPKPGEIETIRDRAREMKISGTDTVLRVTGARPAIAEIAVVEWENFYDVADEVMKCNRQNINMMSAEEGFLDFVDDCLAELERRVKEKADAALGN